MYAWGSNKRNEQKECLLSVLLTRNMSPRVASYAATPRASSAAPAAPHVVGVSGAVAV